MRTFSTSREAKEFLVASIIAESEHDNVVLSQLERDMLYFTESAWCPLEDCRATNEAFELEYDSDEYEQNIAALIRNFCARSRKENPQDLEAWNQAVQKIGCEDHYLLVMIKTADVAPSSPIRIGRPLFFLGAMIVAILLCAVLVVLYFRWSSDGL